MLMPAVTEKQNSEVLRLAHKVLLTPLLYGGIPVNLSAITVGN